MEHLSKTRTCCICGKTIKCECFYSDYALCVCNGSGKTFVEFDACDKCIDSIVKEVKRIVHK